MANNQTATSPWNDERIAQLRRLVAKEFTAQEIADAMGGVFSRNAIIGKVARLGLRLNQPQGVRPDEGPRPPKPKKLPNTPPQPPVRAHRCAATAAPPESPPTPEMLPGPLPRAAVEPGNPVTILELQSHHCRWPMWGAFESQRVYCGNNREEPHPYCSGHAAAAYPNRKL